MRFLVTKDESIKDSDQNRLCYPSEVAALAHIRKILDERGENYTIQNEGTCLIVHSEERGELASIVVR